jgi:hypothetical protein
MVSHGVSSQTASWASRVRKVVNGWSGALWRRLPLLLVFSGKLVSVARHYFLFAFPWRYTPRRACDPRATPDSTVDDDGAHGMRLSAPGGWSAGS